MRLEFSSHRVDAYVSNGSLPQFSRDYRRLACIELIGVASPRLRPGSRFENLAPISERIGSAHGPSKFSVRVFLSRAADQDQVSTVLHVDNPAFDQLRIH